MGMFDWIICEMPLPDGWEPPRGTEFQTKDLDCLMDTYVLAEDGTITDSKTGERVEHHGALEFYTSNWCATGTLDDGRVFWVARDGEPPWKASYVALYDHGRLLKLEGGKSSVDGVVGITREEWRAIALLRYPGGRRTLLQRDGDLSRC